ncbi:hypothetical protein [Curtobacterium sp. Leaf261]|uniref:hypothetical protein n=1 Tax=Curtobacterium sp. Leaf261 TaxID=1736311 RepID=UPI0006F7E769|nr:hypothetical protein [Curtobacterium sp. Leaf261]KQO62245.1 hypothetical protein ASF23_10545 [Curtobacterium sp. Leaf261]
MGARGRTAQLGDARGSVTVEFAVVLPAVVVVVGLAAGLVAGAAMEIRLQVAGAAVARAVGRGDSASATALAAELAPGGTVRTIMSGSVVCATASAPVPVLGAVRLPATATVCAANGGR